MGRTIVPARYPAGGVPQIRSMQYVAGQTFIQGAPLKLSAGQVTEASAGLTSTSANLVGFAMEPAASKLGFGMPNTPTQVTGRSAEVSVSIADRLTIFSGQLVNNSAVPIAPLQTDVGNTYGIKGYVNAAGNNEYYVDKNLITVNACVEIVDVDLDQNIVFFKVLEASLQP